MTKQAAMNHAGDEASNGLFVFLLPGAPWLAWICEPCGSATLSRGFGMGKLGDLCCDLRAELRPQGGVGLGRMELVVPGEGTVLPGDPKCCRAVGWRLGGPVAAEAEGAVRTTAQGRLEDRSHWE